jgi:hypothetical protein
VGEFDPGLQAAEDWEYFLRAAARWPFAVVPRYQSARDRAWPKRCASIRGSS